MQLACLSTPGRQEGPSGKRTFLKIFIVPLFKERKSGNISTDRAILENLVEDDKIGLIKRILDHRTYIKLLSG